MFQQAHIPNAGFAGPGSQANGMILLKKFSAPLSKNKLIVSIRLLPMGQVP